MPNTLGQPIDAGLNLGVGGNPLAGYAGGVAGLAQQYGLDYNNYINTNKQLYDKITAGYGTVMANVGNSLGQGGTPWGVAQGAADDINSAARNAAGGAISRSISSGTGKSTAAAALQRGVLNTQGRQLRDLGLGLADKYAGYEAQLGQNQLNFMNSVTAPPPNAAAYGMLAQQYGQAQQQQANLGLQQQALNAQTRAANQAAAARGSGQGGVSIPQMPRGGTYGSGATSFPSGGGVTPTSGNANPWASSGPSISGYPGGGGFGGSAGVFGGSNVGSGSQMTVGGGQTGSQFGGMGGSVDTGFGGVEGEFSGPYNPWDPNSQLPANAPGVGGMGGAAGAATGGTGGGFGDMTNHFGFAGMNPWGAVA